MTRRNKQKAAVGLESLETRQVLSAAPTAELQYALELINLTRTNPAAAAERITSNLSPATKGTLEFYNVDLEQAKKEIASADARQPLAWSDQLANAAQAHSEDMAANGFQSHTGSDGSSPADRVQRAGYGDTLRLAENAFAYSESMDQAIQAFVIDWGVADKGHRRNIQEPGNGGDDSFKEVGIGSVQSKRVGMGKVVTQKFGVRKGASAQLLGVAYDDRDKNGFYTIGEGVGDLTLEITGNGATTTVETADAGGYQVELKPGSYKVKVSKNGQELQTREIKINSKNVKYDVVTSELSTPTPAPKPKAATPTPNKPANTVNIATKQPNTPAAKPVSTPVKVATPPLVTIPNPANPPAVVSTPKAVTILSNLTAQEPSEPEPAPATLSNANGFTWNVWKSVPKG